MSQAQKRLEEEEEYGEGGGGNCTEDENELKEYQELKRTDSNNPFEPNDEMYIRG